MELGETLKDCLAREVEEEIGVSCVVEDLFCVDEWFAERGDDVMQFIGLFYICDVADTDFKFQEAEVDGAEWVGLEEIENLDIIEPSKSVIKSFLNREGAELVR